MARCFPAAVSGLARSGRMGVSPSERASREKEVREDVREQGGNLGRMGKRVGWRRVRAGRSGTIFHSENFESRKEG
jgi:hypothetical protein